MVKKALSLGACGYVLKALAAIDLLAAVKAVILGKYSDGSA
jgi:DNA-binding NarL/FixJ family response regulator